MIWTKHRDALVEDTLAFLKNVKGEPTTAWPTAKRVLAKAPEPLAPPIDFEPVRPTEREEIKQRVANFRAHQERVTREREDYYFQVKAKTAALISGLALPPSRP